MDYLLGKVIAKNQVNLIGGSSGSGKTRFIFQFFEAAAHGRQYFGQDTNWATWGYITADRSHASIAESLSELGIEGIQIFSMVDRDLIGEDLVTKVIPMFLDEMGNDPRIEEARAHGIWEEDLPLPSKGFQPNLLLIDGFSSLCPGGKLNDYNTVAKWLGGLTRWCNHNNTTIIGVCHSTKAREGSGIINPAERLLGSVAWAGYTEGLVVITEPSMKPDKKHHRDIFFRPRNRPDFTIEAMFDTNGRLGPREDKPQGASDLLNGLLKPGTELLTSELEDFASENIISRTFLFKWIKAAIASGTLLRQDRGRYAVAHEVTLVREEEDLGI